MRWRFYSDLDDLASDLHDASVRVKRGAPKVVRKNNRAGRTLARRIARKSAGIHGRKYFKRITDEMTGPLRGEYGPTALQGGEEYVGAGWRNGPGNTDLPKSADVIGPKFAKDAADLLDGLL